MTQPKFLTASEAAQKAGCCTAYLKRMAQETNLDREILRVGKRQDWLFTPEQVRQLSGFIKKDS